MSWGKTLKCQCGQGMYLERKVYTNGRSEMVFLCKSCALAYSPIKQWIPGLKELKFKLPSGEITSELGINTYEYHACNGRKMNPTTYVWEWKPKKAIEQI